MTSVKEYLAEISNSRKHIITMSKYTKTIFLSIFAFLLLIAVVIGIVAGVNSRNNNSTSDHAIVKSSCSSTFYPELCYSAITKHTSTLITNKIKSQKDVIEASLNITISAVENNFFDIVKLLKKRDLTKRQKIALHDCLETLVDDTLDELHNALEHLEEYYPDKKSVPRHANDLKTMISAAITNQETCLDGFSHDDADRDIRGALLEGQANVEKMCSNALAMIKNMTDTDAAKQQKLMGNRKQLKEEEEEAHGDQWPQWLSDGDRRLLGSLSAVRPDVVVAADGGGDFKTVSEAVAAAPEKSNQRYIIHIKAGVYRENVEVPKKKTNIMFIGDGRSKTIITAERNVVDGDTTFHSATVGT